jgi:hypothetical protein
VASHTQFFMHKQMQDGFTVPPMSCDGYQSSSSIPILGLMRVYSGPMMLWRMKDARCSRWFDGGILPVYLRVPVDKSPVIVGAWTTSIGRTSSKDVHAYARWVRRCSLSWRSLLFSQAILVRCASL